MKIFQIADIHFGTEDPQALEKARKIISSEEADLLAISGDLTQNGRTEEFLAAADWLNTFSLPKIIVPGNHDTPMWNLVARTMRPFVRFNRYFSGQTRLHSFEGVTVRGINTARGLQIRRNWAEGSVNLDELKALITPLHTDQQHLGILIAHHPFLPPKHSTMRIRTSRGRRASTLLANSTTDILLCGHIHKPGADVWTHDNGRYVAITAGTLSTRIRTSPPGFNVIEIDEETIAATHYALHTDKTERGLIGKWDRKTLTPL